MTPQEEIEQIDKELSKYKDVIKKISYLNKRKKTIKDKLDKQLLAKLPFEQQFKKWCKSTKEGRVDDWIPDAKKFPALRKWIQDDDNMQRYKTIDVREHFSEEFALIYDLKWRKEYLDNKYGDQDDIDKIKAIAKEVMKANLTEFTIDW